MDKNNKNLFDDLSSMTKSAISGAINMKRELVSFIKEHVEQMIRGMNFVKREEFEALERIVLEMRNDAPKADGQDKQVKKKSAKLKSKTSDIALKANKKDAANNDKEEKI